MIKALIFDLDGTIVRPDTGTYSAETAKAFAALRKKGIYLIAATGRSPYELKVTKMIDGLSFDAIVCLNGQYCYTETTDLFINAFPEEQAEQMLKIIEESGVPCAVIEKDGTTINKVLPYVEAVQAGINMPVPKLRDLNDANRKGIIMLTAFLPEEEESTFLQALPPVISARWSPNATDLLPAGSGKSSGVEIALKHFGLKWEDTYAFGDGDNDYEMLKCAGKGFAMQNSRKCLLNGEFEIVDSVYHDGVVKTLHQYGIL